MSEHQQVNRRQATQQDDVVLHDAVVQDTTTSRAQDDGFDSLLDEIDGLLETNAAEYVRSFVQKGGQ